MGGLEGFVVGVQGFQMGVWEDLTSVCHFCLLSISAIITCAIFTVPLLPVQFLPCHFYCAIFTQNHYLFYEKKDPGE